MAPPPRSRASGTVPVQTKYCKTFPVMSFHAFAALAALLSLNAPASERWHPGLVGLALSNEIRTEMALTPDQTKRLRATLKDEPDLIALDVFAYEEAGVGRRFREQSDLATILTSAQLDRLLEIEIQSEGPFAALHPDVQERLGLSLESRHRLMELASADTLAFKRLAGRRATLGGDEFARQSAEANTTLGTAIEKELGTEEVARLKAMEGGPAKVDYAPPVPEVKEEFADADTARLDVVRLPLIQDALALTDPQRARLFDRLATVPEASEPTQRAAVAAILGSDRTKRLAEIETQLYGRGAAFVPAVQKTLALSKAQVSRLAEVSDREGVADAALRRRYVATAIARRRRASASHQTYLDRLENAKRVLTLTQSSRLETLKGKPFAFDRDRLSIDDSKNLEGIYRVVVLPEVASELKLTEAQRARLLTEPHEPIAFYPELRDREAAYKAYGVILTPAQLARLVEIDVQSYGPSVVELPYVETTLGLSEEQKDRLGDVTLGTGAELATLKRLLETKAIDQAEYDKRRLAVVSHRDAAYAATLTPAQTERLKTMAGTPFRFAKPPRPLD